MMRTFKKLFFDDLGLKLWSFFLALVFWYAIQGEKNVEDFIAVKVAPINRPSALIITNKVIDQIHLRVRGSQSQIDRLKKSPPDTYTIDLSRTTPGRALYRVFPFDFRLPKEVEVTRINPQLITVELEEQKSRVIPIAVNFRGELENGFSVTKTEIIPQEVTVVGAESVVDALHTVFTSEINLDGIRENFSKSYRLLIPQNPNIWVDGETSAFVKVSIKESVISGIIEPIPIMVKGKFKEVTLVNEKATLVVQGPAGLVNDMLENMPEVYIDARAVKVVPGTPRTVRLRLRHNVGEECKVLKLMPEIVSVVLRK